MRAHERRRANRFIEKSFSGRLRRLRKGADTRNSVGPIRNAVDREDGWEIERSLRQRLSPRRCGRDDTNAGKSGQYEFSKIGSELKIGLKF